MARKVFVTITMNVLLQDSTDDLSFTKDRVGDWLKEIDDALTNDQMHLLSGHFEITDVK